MAKNSPRPGLSPLASKVLADHQRAPEVPFYDLFSLGTFFDLTDMGLLDAAYSELEGAGYIERADGHVVNFAGRILPMFRIRSSQSIKGRRKSA